MARQRDTQGDEGLKARRDEVEALRELTTQLTVVGRTFQAPSVVPAQVQQQAGLNARIGAAFTPGPPVVTPISPRPAPPVAQLVNPRTAAPPVAQLVSPRAPAAIPIAQPIAAAAPAAGGAAGSLGSVVSSLAGSVGVVTAAFTGAAVAVGSFVNKANPATMERFHVILDDVTAVIGQTLTPVIETLGEGVRLVGDVLASILPSAGDVREALAPVGQFLRDLREAIAPVVPIIKDVLVGSLRSFGTALRIVLAPLGELAKVLGSFFGVEDAGPLKSSVGAAARNISFTNPEQFARSVNVAAFRGAAGQEPVVHINTKMDTVINRLGSILLVTSNILSILPGGKGLGSSVTRGLFGLPGLLFGGKKDEEEAGEADKEERGGSFFDRIPNAGLPLPRERGARPDGAGNGFPPGIGDAIVEAIRRGMAEGGNGRDPLAEGLDQAKRRGMDGHPGSA